MSIEALKEQAREYEQNEQWEKALDLYTQAIDQISSDDEPDVGLFNRSGDLATRIGRDAQAVTFYEKAVDFYMAAGLPNNAIAICKKVMRNLPNRYSIYLKMGQIRAAQGFVTDARSSFVTYAERVQASGDLDEAFRALIEFVDLAPDDYEIRVMLASQLEQNGRHDEAVQQFIGAYHSMMRQGLNDQARNIEARIRALDPHASLDVDPTLAAPRVGGGDGMYSGSGHEGEAVADSDADAPPSELEDEEPQSGLGDLPLLFYDDDEIEDAPAAQRQAKDGAAKAAEEQAAAKAAEEKAAAEAAAAKAAKEKAAAEAAAAKAAEEKAAAKAAEEKAAADAAAAKAAEEKAAAKADLEAAQQVASDALTSEALTGHEALAAAGDLAGAIAELTSLIGSNPDDLSCHLRMVEYAFRLNDSSILSNAYLGLAECLERGGQMDRAEGVFRQVLSTDPENERARKALGLPKEGALPAEAPSEGSYVDVGAMLLGSDAVKPAEKSTRFVVPYEEPTGDDQADFQRMLSQFREKVSENIDPSDAIAHYDLGTAYMEMGLLDEAISEFQQSLRGAPDHLPTYEMLGQTFMQKEEPEAALRSLTRALETPCEIEDELVAIYYYLGLASETVGNRDSALEYYDRVFALDINFADVTQRIRALRD